MNKHPVIVIGGSAGSLDVLMRVFPLIDVPVKCAIIVIMHRKNIAGSRLIMLLSSKTKLRVKEIEEKEAVLPGIIYVAPANYHVLIEQNGTFSLDYSEKVNFSRPSIDVTFQAAAEVYKANLACLLLSGSNSDGSEGLKAVKKHGGLIAIQEPSNADFAFMPRQAAQNVAVDKILEIDEMHMFINNLAVNRAHGES